MNKLTVCLLAAFAFAACKPSSKWSWNGLTLGMPAKDAKPIVQRLCGSAMPLEPRSFPQVQTEIVGCDASTAEVEGQRVGLDVQFYEGKLLVVTLTPKAAPSEWWRALESALDKKYGPGKDDPRNGETAREWKTKDGEWIRTRNDRSIHFAAYEPMMRRSELAAKQKKEKPGPADEE
jgi:hypothetical protein